MPSLIRKPWNVLSWMCFALFPENTSNAPAGWASWSFASRRNIYCRKCWTFKSNLKFAGMIQVIAIAIGTQNSRLDTVSFKSKTRSLAYGWVLIQMSWCQCNNWEWFAFKHEKRWFQVIPSHYPIHIQRPLNETIVFFVGISSTKRTVHSQDDWFPGRQRSVRSGHRRSVSRDFRVLKRICKHSNSMQLICSWE